MPQWQVKGARERTGQSVVETFTAKTGRERFCIYAAWKCGLTSRDREGAVGATPPQPLADARGSS